MRFQYVLHPTLLILLAASMLGIAAHRVFGAPVAPADDQLIFLPLAMTREAPPSSDPVRWTGKGDGTRWNDPANWSGNAVPGQNDSVQIDLPGNILVSIDSGFQAKVKRLDSRETLQLGDSAALTITENAAFTGEIHAQNAALAIGGVGHFNGLSAHSEGLTSQGSISVTGSMIVKDFSFEDGATFRGGTIEVHPQTDVLISGSVVVNSIFEVSSADSVVTVEGTLTLTGGGESHGTLHLVGGTVILQNAYTIVSSGQVTGTGTIDISDATLTNNGSVGPNVTIIN